MTAKQTAALYANTANSAEPELDYCAAAHPDYPNCLGLMATRNGIYTHALYFGPHEYEGDEHDRYTIPRYELRAEWLAIANESIGAGERR